MTVYPIEGFETEPLADEVLEAAIDKVETSDLRRGLRDGRVAVRANCARAIGFKTSVETAAAIELAVLLRDGKSVVRLGAAASLGRLRLEPISIVPRLLLVLRVADEEFRQALLDAVQAYADIDKLLQDALDQPGDRILPSLRAVAMRYDDRQSSLWMEVLGDRHRTFRARANAAELLARLGLGEIDESVEAAIKDFEMEGINPRQKPDPASDRRKTELQAPLPIEVEGFYDGPLDDKALKAAVAGGEERLRRALHDGRDFARLNAARTIGLLGKKGGDAFIEELAVRVRDSNTRVGIAAAESLAKLAIRPELSVAALGRSLSTHHAQLRIAVLKAIDAYGSTAAESFLAELTRNPDEQNVQLLTTLAEKRPDDYVLPLAKIMVEFERPKARERAAQVLANLGPLAKKAKSSLLAVLDVSEGAMRIRALDALGRIGDKDKKTVDRILKLAKEDSRMSVRYSIRLALDRLGVPFEEDEEED